MPANFGALTMVLVVGMVLARVHQLKGQGIKAMHFGNLDKKDYLIPPFAFFYFYILFAHAFGWPVACRGQFFDSAAAAWAGVSLCLAGLLLLWGSLVSFGRSFRVGIDIDHPDKLVTTGVFAVSRNPIYAAFLLILAGQALIYPNGILLAYFAAALWLIHRQVLREEAYMKKHYGREYLDYCRKVRRYF